MCLIVVWVAIGCGLVFRVKILRELLVFVGMGVLRSFVCFVALILTCYGGSLNFVGCLWFDCVCWGFSDCCNLLFNYRYVCLFAWLDGESGYGDLTVLFDLLFVAVATLFAFAGLVLQFLLYIACLLACDFALAVGLLLVMVVKLGCFLAVWVLFGVVRCLRLWDLLWLICFVGLFGCLLLGLFLDC